MDKPNEGTVDFEVEKAKMQAIADRTGFVGAGRIMTLLAALRCAPTLEGRVAFQNENGGDPKPGPRVIEMLIVDLCEAHQAALTRITQLETLVIRGELRERLANIEASKETLANQVAALTEAAER